jgi:NTE family protein
MLAELTDRGIKADRVYGASVGAVNGAAYAGDPTKEGVEHLERVWMGLTGNDVFPRGRMDGPWMFFQQRQSVHSNSGLRKIVTEGIDYERLEDAVLPFEVVATSLTNGREHWITHGPAVDAILASAAIPAIFPPVVIDGDTLVDGGVTNNVPISRAIEGGATRIYVLLCGPLYWKPRLPRRPVEAVLNAFFVAIHARFMRELENLPEGVEVVVFSGGGEPEGAYRDFSATGELIAQGRTEVAATLDLYGSMPQQLVTSTTPPAARPDHGGTGQTGDELEISVNASGSADGDGDANGAEGPGGPQADGRDGDGERPASSRTAPQAARP